MSQIDRPNYDSTVQVPGDRIFDQHTPKSLKEDIKGLTVWGSTAIANGANNFCEVSVFDYIMSRLDLARVCDEHRKAFASGLIEGLAEIGSEEFKRTQPADQPKATQFDWMELFEDEDASFRKLLADFIQKFRSLQSTGFVVEQTEILKLGFMSLDLASRYTGGFNRCLYEATMKKYPIAMLLGIIEPKKVLGS